VKADRQSFHLSSIIGICHQPSDFGQTRNQLRVSPPHCPAGGEAIDQPEEIVVVTNRVFIERVDEGAMVEFGGQPAFPFQSHYCFADRDSADSEFLCDLVLGQSGARSKLSHEDQLPNVDRRLFPAAAESDGADFVWLR
jgi:hypothetical protein